MESSRTGNLTVDALAQARDLVAAVEAATEDPGAIERVRAGAYHLAGLLDALGLLPFDAAAAVAAGIEDYTRDEPGAAGGDPEGEGG